jgi:hypothetical protein
MLNNNYYGLNQIRESYLNSEIIRNYYNLIRTNIGDISYENYIDEYLMTFYQKPKTQFPRIHQKVDGFIQNMNDSIQAI